MANKIVEQYFAAKDFSERIPEVQEAVCQETGFVVEREVFRGKIFDDNKVQTVVCVGVFEGRLATLKLQGLKLAIEEADLMAAFTAQNTSTVFRAPAVYRHMPFNESRGYGYTIMEYIDERPLYGVVMSEDDENDFVAMYHEYKTKAVVDPLFANMERVETKTFFARADNWMRIARSKGVVDEEKLGRYRAAYDAAVTVLDVPVVFMHGHFTRKDLHRTLDGAVAFTSNAFWGYRPQWYDLAFFLWERLMTRELPNFPVQIDHFIELCQRIPCVAQDAQFERIFRALIKERAFGALVVDIGAGRADALAARDAEVLAMVAEWESVLLGCK